MIGTYKFYKTLAIKVIACNFMTIYELLYYQLALIQEGSVGNDSGC